MKEPNKESVIDKPADGGSADPIPAETPKEVTSPEVKVEVSEVESTNEPIKVVDKQQEQIDNLNIALKQAREEAKNKVDQSKVAELEAKLAESQSFIERIQGAISPEKEIEEETPKYLTAEEAEELFQQKQEEIKQAAFKEKQSEIIKNEISILEKEWNGVEGKPKYSDEEVLKWQQDNNKLYLSPVEAFTQMKKSEIIDWEVKQRLAGKKSVENVEQPGVSPDVHTPADDKPQTDQEVRKQIESALEMADVEM